MSKTVLGNIMIRIDEKSLLKFDNDQHTFIKPIVPNNWGFIIIDGVDEI